VAEARNRWTGPCVAGQKRPICHFWKARIAYRSGGKPIAGVADGDTLRVDILGDGSSAPKSVRITGINAMELRRYSNYPDRRRGACHAREATALIERYIERAHRIVRLGAQHASSRTGKRLYRSVAVRLGGRWRDLGRIAVESGQAIWLPNGREYAHNEEYHELGDRAAGARRGLHDPGYCGTGPSEEADIRMSVNWDADGSDDSNLNGEWVKLRNLGRTDVPLGGWRLRDSFLRSNSRRILGFEFPSWARIRAGASVKVYAGCAQSSENELYWCQRSAVFENATYDHRHMGDGGYLFDPQGDLRASMTYPCVFRCGDPLRGVVEITSHPRAPEHVRVNNAGSAAVDLEGYVLKVSLRGSPALFTRSYAFPANSAIAAGATLRLWIQGSPRNSDRSDRYWGLGSYLLPDGGGRISLRTFTDVVVACDAWGSVKC
jgi:endonuclease YncB( thermonuclease family)